ncbi:MAG: hypothetical protein KIT81_08235 [Alphaproteobacteria bacterium]|nr:hypothetical protein [Alphaproteobacteria bacterium]
MEMQNMKMPTGGMQAIETPPVDGKFVEVVVGLVKAGYLGLAGNLAYLIGSSWLLVAIAAGATLVLGLIGLGGLGSLVAGLALLVFASRWVRVLLLQESSGPIEFGKRDIGFIVNAIVVAIVAGLPAGLVNFLLAPILGGIAAILALVVGLGGAYLGLRLSLSPLGAAIGQPVGFGESWSRTGANPVILRFMVAAIAAAIPFAIINGLLATIGVFGGSLLLVVAQAVIAVINFISTAVLLAQMTMLYRMVRPS